MQVLKFGGSSVANAENIQRILSIVTESMQKEKTVVVVSALGGITDTLLQCGKLASEGNEAYHQNIQLIEQRHVEAIKALIPVAQQSSILSWIKQRCNELEDICKGVFLLHEMSDRTKDKIASFGELMSSQLVTEAFKMKGVPAVCKDARELIVTNANYGYAEVLFELTNSKIEASFAGNPYQLIIIPGFIASDSNGITTTLGRGGSDYTAAIFAAALNASILEIWTDVSGMMTADPRLVANAKKIPNISYEEAMELSHFGAKVIYPPTIQPVMKKGITVAVKNTFQPADEGTIIEKTVNPNSNIIRGISSINKIALLTLEGTGMVGIPGFSKRLFEALANDKINLILITQGSSEHSICAGIEEDLADKAKETVDRAFAFEIETGRLEPLRVEKGQAVIALVGDNMKSHPGISGKMFSAIGRNGVNIRAIAQGASEKNISAVIAAGDVKKAVNVLHEEFFETTYKQVNLFIVGVGNVGSRLLTQISHQQQYLKDHLRLQLNVIGIANSKKMLFNDEGIDPSNWRESLPDGTVMHIENFISIIHQKNLRNSVFADVTASGELAKHYGELLHKSVAVVACNKVACSSTYAYYRLLKDLSREYNAQFLFETNVGAGLPVIGTLNDLMRSGDTINRIEAVLSGTLNFVFNNYTGEKSFAEVVKQAQDEGYTEPDPRLDLGGTDVMRKILILAREAGEQLEMDDVANKSFMPPSCMTGSVDDFYAAMSREENHFKAILDEAKQAGKKLKFVARYANGKASVGLEHIDPHHDFYHLYGKDNVVLFYTNRYTEQPLVIKGAGAGAEVTASGIFADIIRAAKS